MRTFTGVLFGVNIRHSGGILGSSSISEYAGLELLCIAVLVAYRRLDAAITISYKLVARLMTKANWQVTISDRLFD